MGDGPRGAAAGAAQKKEEGMSKRYIARRLRQRWQGAALTEIALK